MSSAGSYPRCALEVRASRLLLVYASSLAALAALAPWLVLPAVPALIASCAAAPAALSLLRWARGDLKRIVWLPDGRWLLTDRAGAEHADVRLLRGIRVGAELLVLQWRCAHCARRFRLALLHDNSDDDARRRLRVRLRVTPDAALF